MYFKKLTTLLILFLFNINFLFAEFNESNFTEDIYDISEISSEHDKIITIPNGPTHIKNISRKMKSPGYWISKLKNPDDIIWSLEDIKKYNITTYDKGLYIKNLLEYPEKTKKIDFQKQINRVFNIFSKSIYLNDYLEVITKKEIDNLKNNARPFPTTGKYLTTRYAMTINYTDVRLLPTKKSFISSKETFDIDRIQVAGLDIGEPLVVISETKDKQWAYVISKIADGWIKTEDFAYTDRDTVSKWINEEEFIVITATKADVFLDMQMNEYYDYVRMGTVFPLIEEEEQNYKILFPRVNKKNELYFYKAYISKKDANINFLPYTQRNIINLAFKHLNSPYSWGGQDGEQDCSTFIRQIFSCFGLMLPRNSSNQIKLGIHSVEINIKDSVEIKTKKIIDNAVEAISLLLLPGHIMLYIGKENNNPYVIHAIWGTENYKNKTKTVSFINRIIVSDLFIGKDTNKGTLIERLTDLNILKE